MAILSVQSAKQGATVTQSATTATFASAALTGNTVIAVITYNAITNLVSTVKNGTTSLTLALAKRDAASLVAVEVWYGTGCTSTTNTVTLTDATHVPMIIAHEFSGVATASPLDGTPVSSSATGSTTITAPSMTPTLTTDLAIACFADDGTATNGTTTMGGTPTYTRSQEIIDLNGTNNLFAAYTILTTSSATNCVWTYTNGAGATEAIITALFKAAAGGATFPVELMHPFSNPTIPQ